MYPGPPVAAAAVPSVVVPASLVTIMPSLRMLSTTPMPCGVLMERPAYMGVMLCFERGGEGGRRWLVCRHNAKLDRGGGGYS